MIDEIMKVLMIIIIKNQLKSAPMNNPHYNYRYLVKQFVKNVPHIEEKYELQR